MYDIRYFYGILELAPKSNLFVLSYLCNKFIYVFVQCFNLFGTCNHVIGVEVWELNLICGELELAGGWCTIRLWIVKLYFAFHVGIYCLGEASTFFDIWPSWPPKALDEDETEFLEKLEMSRREYEQQIADEEEQYLRSFQAAVASQYNVVHELKQKTSVPNSQHGRILGWDTILCLGSATRMQEFYKENPCLQKHQRCRNFIDVEPTAVEEADEAMLTEVITYYAYQRFLQNLP